MQMYADTILFLCMMQWSIWLCFFIKYHAVTNNSLQMRQTCLFSLMH